MSFLFYSFSHDVMLIDTAPLSRVTANWLAILKITSGNCEHRNRAQRPICTATILNHACLSWVKSVVLTLGLSLPVYPDQRTSLDRTGWSGTCQQPASLQLPIYTSS